MSIEIEGADPVNGGFVAGLPPHMVGAAESPDCTNSDPADPWGMTTRQGSSLIATASTGNSGMTTGDLSFAPTADAGLVRGASTVLYFNGATFASAWGFSSQVPTILGAQWMNLLQASTAFSTQTTPMAFAVTDASTPNLFNILTTTVYAASMASTGTIMKFAKTFQNRVFAFGRADGWNPNLVNYCALNDLTDWTTAGNAGSFQVGDPAPFVGGEATRNAFYFFKRRSVWILTGTSPTDFAVELVTDNVGCVSDRGHCSDGQNVYFAADDGIYTLNGMNLSRVSDKVRQEYMEIPNKNNLVLEYRGEKLYCFRCLSTASAPFRNTDAMVACPRRKMETGETQAFWAKWDSMPYGGAHTAPFSNNLYTVTAGSSLQLYKLETGSGAGITLTYNTPDMDFGYPDAVKKLVRWTTHHKPTSASQNWTAQWFADGASTGTAQTFTIASAAGGATHDGANKAGGGQISGSFLRLKLSCVGQVTLYGYEVYADVQVSEDFPRV